MKTNSYLQKEWQYKKIKELGTVVSGGTPSTNNPEYWDGNINWCTPTDITNLKGYKYLGETTRKITALGYEKSSANKLPINSIIVCTRATIGDCAINKVPMTTNQGFKSIIPKKAYYEYLYYLVLSKKQLLLSLANGSTFLEVPKKDFENIVVKVPPLPEQKKIAKILSAWDDTIATIEKLIVAKEKLKKGFMQQLLTGKKRFKEFEGEKWKEKHLIDICEKIQDGNYGGDYPKTEEFIKQGIPFLTSKSIGNNNYISYENINYISSEKHRLLKKAHIKKGDIIFTNRGANVGAVAIVPNVLDNGNIGPQLTLLRCKREEVLNSYLFNFMQCWLFRKQILMQHAGSAMNFFGIDSTSKFKIIVPSLKEQERIASVLSACDKEIQTLKDKLKALQIQKKGLMQQLLTGKVRVKIDDNEK